MDWVLSANSNNCRIYRFQRRPATLFLLKELQHVENRLKKSEVLTSDRPGHYQKSVLIRGSYEPHTDLKEIEVNKFAKAIAKEINISKKNNVLDRLIVFSAPHMMGVISKYLRKSVKNVVAYKFLKNGEHFKESELLDFLKKKTRGYALIV
jgi:protein required for attachment to host cells